MRFLSGMTKRKDKGKRGFTLLEMVMALGISSIALSGLFTMSNMVMEKTQARLISSQALAVASAARGFVVNNKTTVLAGLPAINDAAEMLVSDMQDMGYMPADFVNQNAYGQTYKILVKREDAGVAGPDAADMLVILVVTTGGQTITDKMGSALVGEMGAAGGFIFSDAPTTARGAAGGWQVDLAGAGWAGIAGYTPAAGTLALLANILPKGVGGAVASGGDSILLAEDAECNAGNQGKVRWSTINSTLEICDGSTWRMIATVAPPGCVGPSAFSFTDVTGQSLSTIVQSNTITPVGCAATLTASVTGAGNPQISVNNGTWVTSTTISAGQTIAVRLTTAATVNTAVQAIVQIGTTSTTWTATTRLGQLRIFRTLGQYNGNLGGLAGADAICMVEAGSMGYTGTWKAILSDSTTNARDRLTLVYPIVRASNPSIVVSSFNLWNSALSNYVDEGATEYCATGSSGSGLYAGNSCSNWTTTTTSYTWGFCKQKTSAWMSVTTGGCATAFFLYCIEQ